jgi:hypothetical protein
MCDRNDILNHILRWSYNRLYFILWVVFSPFLSITYIYVSFVIWKETKLIKKIHIFLQRIHLKNTPHSLLYSSITSSRSYNFLFFNCSLYIPADSNFIETITTDEYMYLLNYHQWVFKKTRKISDFRIFSIPNTYQRRLLIWHMWASTVQDMED